jgi:membrane-associated HD superfamily phosphohydrolase
MNTNILWTATVVFAFISVILFFQVDSAWADTHHANTTIIIAGIVSGLIAIGAFIKVAKDWGSGSQP